VTRRQIIERAIRACLPTDAMIRAAYEAGRVQGRLDTLTALQAGLTEAVAAEAKDIRREAGTVSSVVSEAVSAAQPRNPGRYR